MASTSIAATRRTRSSWRPGIVISVSSAAASIASRVRGSVSRGELLLEERRQPRLVDVDDVQRREPGEDVEPAVAVVRLGQGLAQALARVGQAGVEDDGRELGQQAPAVVARGALLQRALEVGGGGVGRAVSRGVGRGAAQQRADLRVGVGAAAQQVAGDAVVVGARGHQRARRFAVQALAAPAGQVVADGARDEVVGEARAAGAEQPGGHQAVARGAQLAERDAGHGRDDLARRALADHGERLDDGAVARRQLGQARAHDGARDRAQRRGVAGGRVERAQPMVGDLAAELAEQPRVAADRAMALAADLERR